MKLTTKAEISKVFAELRKYGFLVFNFNQKNRFGRGLVGFVDHLIVGTQAVYFIEVKIGKDTIKKDQQELYDMIDDLGRRSKWTVQPFIITSPNEIEIARNIRDRILSNN